MTRFNFFRKSRVAVLLTLLGTIFGFNRSSLAMDPQTEKSITEKISMILQETTEVKCGPASSIDVEGLGQLKVRRVYQMSRGLLTGYRSKLTSQTIAYQAESDSGVVSGVLDFYDGSAKRPIQVDLSDNGRYLIINHKHGTHEVPILRLFTSPSATYDASPFYPRTLPCEW